MTEETKAVVKLDDVSKIYGEGELAVVALNHVTLSIQGGEFAAVAGPSGSGKSTLLNIVSGLDQPSAGTVYLRDRDLSTMNARELSDVRLNHVGFVFQAYNLLPVLTAFENAEYTLMLQKVEAEERRTRVMSMLERVGLGGMENRFPNQLSGGQQQRVAIARAIVSNPELILADEPTANLDSKTGADLLDLMEALNAEQGTTFVFSSHDPAVLERAKRLIILRDGAVEEDRSSTAA